MRDTDGKITMDRRTFVGMCMVGGGLLAIDLPMSGQAEAATDQPAGPDLAWLVPQGAKTFHLDEHGVALMPDTRLGRGLEFTGANGEWLALVTIERILHVGDLESPATDLWDLAKLDLELDVSITFDPSSPGHIEQKAGYARLEVGLLDAQGHVDYSICTRTATHPAVWHGFLDTTSPESMRLRFGQLRLPLPRQGYVATSVVPDEWEPRR